MKEVDKMYRLNADGCVPLELTKEEYDRLFEIVITGRKISIRKEIQTFADTVGVEKAKNIIREILHSL